MNATESKSKKWQWIAGVVLFLLASWLFANWAEFKEGYSDGYRQSSKGQR